jgi:hypothetical protein
MIGHTFEMFHNHCPIRLSDVLDLQARFDYVKPHIFLRRAAMRKLAIVLGVFILFSLVMQTPVHGANNWYAGLQLGPEFLTNNTEDNWDNAVAFGVYGGYRLDRQLSLEGSLTTASHDGRGDSDLTITSLLFGPRLTAPVNRNLNLYGDAGFGIYFLDPDEGNSRSEGGIYLGAGLEFPLQQGIKIGMDFKYHVLFDNHPLDSDLVTLLFRLGF